MILLAMALRMVPVATLLRPKKKDVYFRLHLQYIRVCRSLLIFLIFFYFYILFSLILPRNTTDALFAYEVYNEKGSFWAIYLQYRMDVLLYRHLIE